MSTTLASPRGSACDVLGASQRFIDLLPVAIYVCDRDGCIVRHNRSAAALWGREPSPQDRFCGSLALRAPDGTPIAHAHCPMANALRTGRAVSDAEVLIDRPDGETLFVLVNIEPIRDASGAVVGAVNCFRDITEQRRMHERQELLLREMDHRVKNLFALASGIVGLSARGATTPQETAEAARRRLEALARAHTLTLPGTGLSGEETRSATLAALVDTIVSPFVDPRAEEPRIVVDGPEVILGGGGLTSFALLLHEFATNAAKYGALSSFGGRVIISWRTDADTLHLAWREVGGPAPSGGEAAGEGFGSVLARSAVRSQLGGSLAREWRPDGLVVTLTARLDRLA
ncbi:HWE histidine kinase domain-containing protein [Chelatococcus sp. XZ-Ab1]|uniref:HWE histidine kinase domain-containing protein n=1 Tax=Chelatococcus sp. XZ-Ab1 TaxID=3034027 RepID=UPI0023E37061|nr:HWE histidine kinase domain-containing protein [Chelatococcus sp. XZ-Ab1]